MVRNLDEVEGARFHTQVEAVGIPQWSPVEAQFPAVQIAAEAQVGISDPLRREILTARADVHVPVRGKAEATPEFQAVGDGAEGILIKIKGGDTEGHVVADTEVFE